MTRQKLTAEEFIKKARNVHGDKFIYDKVNYIDSKTKICIVCPKHGEFWQRPNDHLCGNGCPMCKTEKNKINRLDTLDTFIEKARKIHGDKYIYTEAVYKNTTTPLTIICRKHGAFQQMPNSHLQGHGCPKCGIDKSNLVMTNDQYIEKARKVHGDEYDYSFVEYKTPLTPIKIICKKHGVFLQKPSYHLSGNGCPKCGYEKVHKDLAEDKESFIAKAKVIYGGKYVYDEVKYVNNKTHVKVICPKHGEFWVRPDNHINAHSGCPRCATKHSEWEMEIYAYIKEKFDPSVILGDKTVLNGLELDIFSKKYNIAIECDGLRWHSEEFKLDKLYHAHKTEECQKKGIRLIHIFEDEWYDKKEIVQSRLDSLFGKITNKIYARNCKVVQLENSICESFLNQSHIQGSCRSSIRYGLVHNEKLVAVMTFGNLRRNLGSKGSSGSYELLRFCNSLNTVVVGGASKLLKHFINDYHPKSLISYCDLRWSNGNMYEKLGFTLDHISSPSYFYIVGAERKNRFLYRKDVLVKEGYDSSKTEHEIMLERGIYRIYDCGCKVYKMVFIEP